MKFEINQLVDVIFRSKSKGVTVLMLVCSRYEVGGYSGIENSIFSRSKDVNISPFVHNPILMQFWSRCCRLYGN